MGLRARRELNVFGDPTALESHRTDLKTRSQNREAVACDSLGRKSQVFGHNDTMSREAAADAQCHLL